MAYTFSVNNTPLTAPIAFYGLISTLVTAGWTKMSDSDGTTYSSSGVQVTSGATGSGGLGNNHAWVRLQSPPTNGGAITNQTREVIFQRGTSDFSWRIKYSAHGKFIGGIPNATSTPMNETTAAYSEINQSGTTALNNTVFGAGQSFTGNGSTLQSVRFWLKRTGSTVGLAYAKVYAHSGTFGTSSIPIGAALAVSAAFDTAANLTTSYAQFDLKFLGSNNITLTNGVNYVVVLEFAYGTGSITLDVGTDTTTPTDPGNLSTYNGSVWTATAGTDVCFYVCTGIQDEVVPLGFGTEAVPQYTSWVTTNGAYRWHIVCGGADEHYSWVAWAIDVGGGSAGCSLALDVMVDGSYSPLDVDPAVMWVSGAYNNLIFSQAVPTSYPVSNTTNPALGRAWLGPVSSAGFNITGSNNVNVSMVSMGSSAFGGTFVLGTNPWTNKDDMVPALWASTGTAIPRGVKGFSTLFMLGTVARRYMATADTINSGSKDKVFVQSCWLPWSGVTPIL